jgi:hypothetical protein
VAGRLEQAIVPWEQTLTDSRRVLSDGTFTYLALARAEAPPVLCAGRWVLGWVVRLVWVWVDTRDCR